MKTYEYVLWEGGFFFTELSNNEIVYKAIKIIQFTRSIYTTFVSFLKLKKNS